MQKCPNCKANIQDKLFKLNRLVDQQKTDLINAFTEHHAEAYCDECFAPLAELASKNIKVLKKEVSEIDKNYIQSFPVLSIDNPKGWDYKVIGLLSKSMSVFPGVEYKASGEQACIHQLRLELLTLNGNAILGTSINYAVIDQSKFSKERIVSVYGTAVYVKNTDSVFPTTHHIATAEYLKIQDQRDLLNKFKIQ